MKNYKFYEDPGHAWLAVKRAELIRLGILDKISHYSYQKGVTVYLEEDCDASTFIAAKQDRGEKMNFIEVHQENTPIRNYEYFKP